MQRTPPRESDAMEHDSIRDLSQSIVVIKPEMEGGVHTGTRSKTKSKISNNKTQTTAYSSDPLGIEQIIEVPVPMVTQNMLFLNSRVFLFIYIIHL